MAKRSKSIRNQGAGRPVLLLRRPHGFTLLVAGTLTAIGTVQMALAGGGSLRGIYVPATPAASLAAQAAAAASSAAAAKQAQSMAAAAQALRDAQQSQNIARQTFLLNMPRNLGADPRNPGQQLPNVLDGLGPNGLNYDAAAIKSDPTLWQGANLPTQFNDGGKAVVSIQQTSSKAILNWQTFNVGSNTTLNFLQGGTDWVALNRVSPGGSSPSQILGSINAPGSVYVINQNGIIFGGGSQVNVHSLIASSLDVGDYQSTRAQRDSYFLNSGIASEGKVGDNLARSFSSLLDRTSSQVDGDVTVQRGASINATVAGSSHDEPGFVYLFGPNVTNSGSISAPLGEVALVAAREVALVRKVYDPAQNGIIPTDGGAADLSVAIRGDGFSITPYATLIRDSGSGTISLGQTYRPGTGKVVNDGVISTPGGATVLNGDTITMSGVISADSGIYRNSQVFLDAATSVDLTGTISILPLENNDTPLPSSSTSQGSSSVTAFLPPTVEMSAFQINLASSALISAPGASVAVKGISTNFNLSQNNALLGGGSPSEQIVMQSGATIDVSGLQNVQLPATYNIVTFQPRGNEFADMPLQRNGILFGKTLYVDIRNTGTRSDGSTWVGTPLADASGFVNLVGRSIDQLLTTGGAVSMTTELAQNGQVNLQHGSSINVAGGSVSYLPGYVPTTRLLGSDGRIYDISKADPNIAYVAILGQSTFDHPRWNVTETFVSPFNSVYQPGYREGRDAGGLSVQAVTPLINADLQFGAEIGMRQAALGLSRTAVINGISSQASPDQIPSQGYLSLVTPRSVVIADDTVDYDGAKFQLSSAASPVQLSARQLSSYGLSSFSVSANELYVPAATSLGLAAGGRFSATTSGAIDIEGSIAARGGQISLVTDAFSLQRSSVLFSTSVTASNQSDIFVGGTLDTRGQWVNDSGLPSDFMTGPGFINGGSITIKTVDSNTTGNIVLAAGSVLDASSGGYINQKGVAKAQSGVFAGNGGNITLATFQGGGFDAEGQGGKPKPPGANHDAVVHLGGTLRSYGFTTGGTLTIATPAFQIGGTPSTDPNTLNLATSFFSQGGFSSYVLQSPSDTGPFARTITVSQNQTVVLQQANLSSFNSYNFVPTGADIAQFASLTTLPADLRKPVNLQLLSGNIVLGEGATIAADARANISLNVDDKNGSLLVAGSIVDHGGAVSIQAPSVWFGPQARLDLSGQLIASSTFSPTSGTSTSGTLLQGGSLTVDTSVAGFNDTGVLGSVVAEQGASIDVSGAAATIVGRINNSGSRLDPTQTLAVASWSDAGTVSINTGTFLWQGQFNAEAGAPAGNRGTLNLGGNIVALQQTQTSGVNVAALVAAAKNHLGFASPGVVATVDTLNAFDNVFLYAGVYDSTGGLGFLSAALPVPAGSPVAAPTRIRSQLQIYGNVDLHVRNRLYLEAASFNDQTPSFVDPASKDASLNLSANYVLLAGAPRAAYSPSAGTRDLTISGQTIDVQSAAFNNFKNVAFNSAGDIRLTTPPVNDGETSSLTGGGSGQDKASTGNDTTFFGRIAASANLSFTAQRIYPVSGVDFEIISSSLGNADAKGNPLPTVSFNAPSNADTTVPLSAGGSLTVSGAMIAQNGNLFAPLGKITLGAKTLADLSPNDTFTNSAQFVSTTSVVLGKGSRTSVSLGDTVVPYGQTEDGGNWFYNSNLTPLTLPTKSVALNGVNVRVDSGATVDLSGGGDLIAFEFVAGKGGSRDVLSNTVSTGSTTRPNSSSPTVYALLPSTGKQSDVAASDIHFNSYLGDKQPLAGQQVYLDGAAGVAAGWYTLYPSHYATLPNALRLVDYGSSFANPALANGATLADGTQIISGHLGQSSLGIRASGSELFSVQTSSVWRQYSQVTQSSANTYFTAAAGHVGVTQVRPIDAGRLVIGAATSLVLGGTFNTQPAAGGRGGQLDISATKIDVVEPGASPLAGYIGVDVRQIDDAGFESVLIGGVRSDIATGTLITPTATDVRVDLASTALSAPEVILVAGPTINQSVKVNNFPNVTVQAPIDGTGTVTIAAGSVVTATGNVSGDSNRNYFLGSSTSLASFLGGTVDPVTGAITGVATSAASLANLANYASLNGSGALLLVSNSPGVTVTRRNVPSGTVTVTLTNNVSFVLPEPVNAGVVNIESGARVGSAPGSGAVQPQSVVISATARTDGIKIGSGAVIGARSVALAASSFAIGDSVPNGSSGFAITHDVLAHLAAANTLSLQALSGGINFQSFKNQNGCATDCAIQFGDGTSLLNLTLDTPSLTGNGTNVTIAAAGTITLLNSGTGAPSAATAGTGALVFSASEIDLGGGSSNITGFSSVALAASDRVFVKGSGSLAIGTSAAPTAVAITTPNLLVGAGSSGGTGAGSQFVLTTSGNLLLRGTGSAPAPSTELGGNLSINAADIQLDHATIQAVAGTVTLHATGSAGNILLGDSSLISAPGYAQVMGDQIRYAPGGKVVLISDAGDIITSSSSQIDLSQPKGGLGSGGELDITALQGNLVSRSGLGIFDSVISANGAPGRGGIFHLNIKGGLANNLLDDLAGKLSAGGFFNEVDIHTHTGGIALTSGHALTAQTIVLTADESDINLGRVSIGAGAVLDASGAAGGTIEIYGRSVDLDGALVARATDASQSGGSVTVGTSGTASGTYDPTYGYEIIGSAGLLNLGANLTFDLSGGARGGKVTLRAPLLAGGGVNINLGVANQKAQLIGVKDFTLEAYATWSTSDATTGSQHFDGIIDPAGTAAASGGANHAGFYQTTLVNFVQKALTPLAAGISGLVNDTTLPAGTTFHIRPGVSLENPLTTVNNGDITVASAWNLAAGTMSNLQTSSLGYQYFDPATSAIAFAYRFGVDPGALTLRSIRDINVNASISDGFFDYQNLSDPRFANVSTTTAPWTPVPTAPVPTSPTANTISPASGTGLPPLASYDLFPNSLNIVTTSGIKTVQPDSWSYRLSSGADFASANPNAVRSVAIYGDGASGSLAGHGDVILNGHTTYLVPAGTFTPQIGPVALPTMLRTGAGDIAINAARNLMLVDHSAPGVIYSAGRNAPLLPSAGITSNGTSFAIANPSGFVEPNIVAYLDFGGKSQGAIMELGKLTGPATAAAFPEDGGNIVIRAQQDVIGWQNVTYAFNNNASTQAPLYQFYAPWMLSQASGTSGAGAFASTPAAYSPQSAWWIEFGRFGQGVLSAGGNVTVVAGRDVRDFSVSVPTTGRVSGGLAAVDAFGAPNTPVTHVYGGGNMTVRVGRELDSGSFYEGSGVANITVAGSVRSDWIGQTGSANGKINVAVSTVLAVDTGQINLTAGGSITITDIINPAEIHLFPHASSGGTVNTVMDTYGPNSAVRLASIGGNVVVDSVPQLLSNSDTTVLRVSNGGFPSDGVTQTYPAILDVSALSGNITVTPTSLGQPGLVLTDSPSAALNLVAQGSVDLRGGVTPVSGQTYGAIGAGTALIDLAFNPYEPNLGDQATTTIVLAHANDPANDRYDHIYAMTGSIVGAGDIEIPRPVIVRAGRDIIDLNLTAQNIRTSDVSQVIAGRDIRYDGLTTRGGLQIAGPGFFYVEAGRNLGPFLPVSADIGTSVVTQQGIVSSGNAAGFIGNITTSAGKNAVGLVSFPVGNNLYSSVNVGGAPRIGVPNPLFLGSLDKNGNRRGQRNFLLPASGASIVAMFGVASGQDYQAVVNGYIDPTTAIGGSRYLDDLMAFLNTHGGSAANAADAWTKWSTLSEPLQHMFIDEVFFSELKRSATTSPGVGYTMVNTLFPASLGYTSNNTSKSASVPFGSTNPISTGSLDLLHATIQTDQGGDVRLFGPGGQILVGSLGTEPNSNLKLNNLGILTLSGGGVYTFTDQSVLVNSSRVFTEQSGPILMWSSNGDLNAGRGSRTTVSLNALGIFIDNNNYETVDRGGLVTGAGIGTLASSIDVPAGDVTLLAPVGTIDAGDAGIRSTGNVTVIATTVLNAGNISAAGTVSGVPTVSVPALAGVTTPSNAAGTARSAGTDVTGTTPAGQPSVVIVNILGYGGGDGNEPAPGSEDNGKKKDQPGATN